MEFKEAVEKLQKIKPFITTYEDEKNYWQRILNVGYAQWQDKNNKEVESYYDMNKWMEKNFGPLAKFAILLGKYNNQVCNGGHIQYHDNDYTSGFGEEDGIGLHEELTELLVKYGDIPNKELKNTLVGIVCDFELDDGTETCDCCDGNGTYGEEEDCGNCNGGDSSKTEEYQTCDTCDGSGVIIIEQDCGSCEYGERTREKHVEDADGLDTRYYEINERVAKAYDQFFANLLKEER